MPASNLKQAYQYCARITREHYENFPVASGLLPRRLRRPITVIYAYARMIDDYADEGQRNPQQRTALLDEAGHNLTLAALGTPPDQLLYIAMSDVLQQYPSLLEQLQKLLIAFHQDVVKNRYQDFNEVMAYCQNSANPVGHMLLILFNEDNDQNIIDSDAICSSLQLINFLQDIRSDYQQRDRVYLPADELAMHDINEQDINNASNPEAINQLVNAQSHRIYELLLSGSGLGARLRGRLGLEMRMIILGGALILSKVSHAKGDLSCSPRLQKRDWAWIIFHALGKRFTIYLQQLKPASLYK